ncbi:antitoxin [Streptomyces fuscigenes]|uniref:antitoxin n=1 Tax=Streptomyces fuscigenes TaxID=1528880 RepID=UPI001F3C6A28|nr:antitoxin [Streptomyces fuscigenes]MCF3963850.1 antitoxin [Streptomyces fuscigenes]
MGFKEQLKARLAPAREKVSDLAAQHGDRIGQGLDKAARTVDERTNGKYSDRIGAGTGKAKDAIERMKDKDGPSAGGAADPDAPR